jgi:hypothetical protein
MEQETLSSHVSSFHFGSITTALRGSLHYTPIRKWVAVNGYNHSENGPAMPDLLLTVHFNNPDISSRGVYVPLRHAEHVEQPQHTVQMNPFPVGN